MCRQSSAAPLCSVFCLSECRAFQQEAGQFIGSALFPVVNLSVSCCKIPIVNFLLKYSACA